jgi:two-component system phosphate regulon sensor histidine kinase PhoR
VYDAEIHIAPVLSESNEVRFYVGIERDVTESKNLQRSKTDFISLASHNLKTPLSSVRWYSEMLLSGDVGRLSSAQRDYVEEIHKASKRMAVLIQRLLNITRIDLGTFVFEKENVNICQVTKDILAEVDDRIAAKQLTLATEHIQGDCMVVTDAVMVRNAIRNIISNAIKYNREGGTIRVATREVAAGTETNGKSFDDVRVVLSVEDAGLGIPLEEQGNVFGRFFRASNTENGGEEGTGLGLFLAHEVVVKLGGDIWFVSSPEGTTFFIAFPKACPE